MVHIHVRDDDDSASMRFDKFEETVRLIRETGCPVLLNLTSSGGQGLLLGGAHPPLQGAQAGAGLL